MYLENNPYRRVPMKPALAWILAALWMLIIFLLSAQDGTASGSLSNGIAAWLSRFFTGSAEPAAVTALEGVLRSLAHGAVYFILAILVGHALGRSAIQDIRNAILTLLICALYAGSDEWHQAYVPGRACEFTDFAVDMAGALIGILIFQGITTIAYLRQQKSDREEDSENP